MKKSKARGSDRLPAEMYKQDRKKALLPTTSHYYEIWKHEHISSDLIATRIVTILNKGDISDQNAYSGISVLSISGKTVTHNHRFHRH